MKQPPFFTTHSEDESARRDRRNTTADIVNASSLLVAKLLKRKTITNKVYKEGKSSTKVNLTKGRHSRSLKMK